MSHESHHTCPQCGASIPFGERCPTRNCPSNLKTALARPLLPICRTPRVRDRRRMADDATTDAPPSSR